MRELDILRKENKLLRDMCRDLANVVIELFDNMPEDLREMEQARRAQEICRKILAHM